jgi:hypothetical protein
VPCPCPAGAHGVVLAWPHGAPVNLSVKVSDELPKYISGLATLVRYTALSERTMRTCLDRLEAAAIISACDPEIVAARIKRADRRPRGWDLSLPPAPPVGACSIQRRPCAASEPT